MSPYGQFDIKQLIRKGCSQNKVVLQLFNTSYRALRALMRRAAQLLRLIQSIERKLRESKR